MQRASVPGRARIVYVFVRVCRNVLAAVERKNLENFAATLSDGALNDATGPLPSTSM